MGMHIAHKMGWKPRWGAIGRIIDLQVWRKVTKPFCEKRVDLYESGICAPVLLLLNFVIDICDDADVMCVANEIGVLS